MSNQTNEFEARVMISEEQFRTIMSFYREREPTLKIIKNENFYFDTTSSTLAKCHISLRLRIVDEHEYEFTCKTKKDDYSLEITDCLDIEAGQQLLLNNVFPAGEVKKHLGNLIENNNKCYLLASLTNERLEVKENDHLLVIDKNIYGQFIDYNLEVESTNLAKAQHVLTHYCDFFNIKVTDEKYRGKSWRAISGCGKKT